MARYDKAPDLTIEYNSEDCGEAEIQLRLRRDGIEFHIVRDTDCEWGEIVPFAEAKEFRDSITQLLRQAGKE